MTVLRMTADILRPIPMVPLIASARVVRPGRRVLLVEATVSGLDPLILGRIWFIRGRRLGDLPPAPDPVPTPPPSPDTLPRSGFHFTDYDFFGNALDARVAAGVLHAPGRASVWFRLLGPVVEGESPTPLQRLIATADSGNGISWALPFERYLFINTDLSVHLLRDPVGEWFALDSTSHVDAAGRGLAETALFDEHGYLGRSHQALYVDLRRT
jgi:hypothetical protein